MTEGLTVSSGLAHIGHLTCAHGNGAPVPWEVSVCLSIGPLHRHEVWGFPGNLPFAGFTETLLSMRAVPNTSEQAAHHRIPCCQRKRSLASLPLPLMVKEAWVACRAVAGASWRQLSQRLQRHRDWGRRPQSL